MELSPYIEETIAKLIHDGRAAVASGRNIPFRVFRNDPEWAHKVHRELLDTFAVQLDLIEALVKGGVK